MVIIMVMVIGTTENEILIPFQSQCINEQYGEVISKGDNTEMLQSLLEMEFYGERLID